MFAPYCYLIPICITHLYSQKSSGIFIFEPPIAFVYYKDWICMFVVNFFWFVITSFWRACSTWKNWRWQCPWNGFWKFSWLRSSPRKQGCPGGSNIFVQVSWSPRKGFPNYSGYSHAIQVKGTWRCIFCFEEIFSTCLVSGTLLFCICYSKLTKENLKYGSERRNHIKVEMYPDSVFLKRVSGVSCLWFLR